MSGTKALQRIVRYQSLERLSLPSHTFIRDAVGFEICRVEGHQIPPPFGLQVGDDRPQPIKCFEHLAAMFDRMISRLLLLPELEAEKHGRGKQRQKHRDRQDQRTHKPSQRQGRSKD